MFYPENSLKKGGRFHLCWVADSWPARFETITRRQLWAQDIRKICDDLLQVMTNESGRPSHRFSLRLSSQLMRGVVRLYQKKVNSMITDICTMNARIMRNLNRRFNIEDTAEEVERRMVPLVPVLELPVPERPQQEERVEEMLRAAHLDGEGQTEEQGEQSGNIIPNVEDITLKESAIPDFQLPPNENFGEENPEQALQLLQDRTLEQMLGASGPHSTFNVTAHAAVIEQNHTAARLALDNTMERMSDHEVTLFRKSTAQDLLPEESDKEIPIPEIPHPDLPVPTEKELIPEPEDVAVPPPAADVQLQIDAPAAEPQAANLPAPTAERAAVQPDPEPEIITLETLQEGEPPAKRRRKKRLIIDKNHQLSKTFLRERIENIHVDLRCEDFSDDIVDLRVPSELLLRRPARAGARFDCNIARPLRRLFSRNLGLAAAAPVDQREMELALASRARARRATTPQVLAPIPEEPAQVQEPQLIEPQIPEPALPIEDQPVLNQSVMVPDLSAVDVEIADLPTQKLANGTQKRTSQGSLDTSQTKKRRCGHISFRECRSQHLAPPEPEIVEKENIPDNRQALPPTEEVPIIPSIEIRAPSDPERVLSSMLHEAGLADRRAEPEPPEEPRRSRSRRRASDSSETMLGSLDRTKVSLGDSDRTTDSKRFIRDQWGTEGTMVKILKMAKAEVQPLTINALLSFGPLAPGYKCIIAARCFTSILKLKQHGFVKVRKDPDTLEILDIYLGPKFDIS